MIGVLFVCLGNICRSPMADGVFQDLVEKAGLSHAIKVDSAGTAGYHTGESAHRGTQRILKAKGIAYQGRSRQVKARDFSNFDYIIAMDGSNLRDLQRFSQSKQVKLHRLLEFASQASVEDVPDPYYTGNFEYVYDLVLDGCQGLLAEIRKAHQL